MISKLFRISFPFTSNKVFIDSIDTKNLSTIIISSIDGLILYHALFKPRKELSDNKE
ncbi:MAG: hypothetical protein KBF99_08125 [Leptospiraceae bacterium]|nr:hypothetical protein [Leptospiraceae bacterium]MBK9502632.1 hypothetical protein [Leptospiraceae bacterium]MBP9163135.1 hypothetical protein [Leptospiraceae bacterium]